MSSVDGLMTPTSGMTEVGESHRPLEHKASLTNLKPFYPGKRNSVVPLPLEGHNAIMPNMGAMQPVHGQSIGPSEVEDIHAKSIMIDKSMNNQSQQIEERQLTHEDQESDEEDIIPEDERWKSRKCFWQMNEQVRIKWDLFVMILAIWN